MQNLNTIAQIYLSISRVKTSQLKLCILYNKPWNSGSSIFTTCIISKDLHSYWKFHINIGNGNKAQTTQVIVIEMFKYHIWFTLYIKYGWITNCINLQDLKLWFLGIINQIWLFNVTVYFSILRLKLFKAHSQACCKKIQDVTQCRKGRGCKRAHHEIILTETKNSSSSFIKVQERLCYLAPLQCHAEGLSSCNRFILFPKNIHQQRPIRTHTTDST